MKPAQMHTFEDMILDVKKRNEEAIHYVKKTGNCFACKSNPIVKGQLHCQKCIDTTERILKALRGPGFIEI